MPTNLDHEFQYFLARRQELLNKYRGKFVIVKDQKIHGAFRSEMEAIEAARRQFELGTFIVQECSDSKNSYNRMFRSRALCI